MSAREVKERNERKDTLALIYAGTIIGSFLSLMAGLVPLAIGITTVGAYAVTRFVVRSAL